MKLTCNTYDLKAACVKAARVIDKSPSPATNGLLLKAESGVLTVTGYNLTIGISVKIPAMIEISGAIIADAKILTNAAGKLQKENTTLCTDDDILTVQNGRSNLKVKGIPAEQYPELPTPEDGTTCRVDGANLVKLIKKTVFAAADDKGVRMTVSDNLRLCATDGFTLAESSIPCEEGTAPSVTATIPPKALLELSDATDAVEISVSSKHFIAQTRDYTLFSRLMSTAWEIDVDKIIPKNTALVKTDFKALTSALERVQILASTETQPVKMSLSRDAIELSVRTTIGSATDSVTGETDSDLVIGINARYLVGVLKAAETDSFLVSSPVSPLVFKDDSSTYILLPVRLRERI